ncbi:uncharacterized protein LOC135471065 [Liolophura sinensis]|uniref:uncharacterized protein LOC135471065 n=1 Tax=Liolophura sinensis TaxID=3198878 RepID=UPI0031586FC5
MDRESSVVNCSAIEMVASARFAVFIFAGLTVLLCICLLLLFFGGILLLQFVVRRTQRNKVSSSTQLVATELSTATDYTSVPCHERQIELLGVHQPFEEPKTCKLFQIIHFDNHAKVHIF